MLLTEVRSKMKKYSLETITQEEEIDFAFNSINFTIIGEELVYFN